MINDKLLEEIEDNTEWLWTSNLEDEIECISIENLKGILKKYNILKDDN